MTEPLRAAHLFATNGTQVFTHIAPQLARVAEVWQEHELWRDFPVSLLTEIEEFNGALRQIAAWEYDKENARWTRFEKTETGDTLHYVPATDEYLVEGATLSA